MLSALRRLCSVDGITADHEQLAVRVQYAVPLGAVTIKIVRSRQSTVTTSFLFVDTKTVGSKRACWLYR